MKLVSVRVPASVYDGAVQFVNQVRAELMVPGNIKVLRAGIPGLSKCCPLANSITDGGKNIDIKVNDYEIQQCRDEGEGYKRLRGLSRSARRIVTVVDATKPHDVYFRVKLVRGMR